MTITKKGETPVKESSLLASPEPITMYLLLWNIFQYCTGAMSRGRLVGLITAVFTPFGLYTIIITLKSGVDIDYTYSCLDQKKAVAH